MFNNYHYSDPHRHQAEIVQIALYKSILPLFHLYLTIYGVIIHEAKAPPQNPHTGGQPVWWSLGVPSLDDPFFTI